MPITITMPALSPTMTEGTLAKWHVKVGDTIAPGQVIAEIETDKATMEVEAVDEGTIGELLVDEGTEAVAVNTPIARVLEEGEDKSALAEKPAATPAKPEPKAAEPAPQAEEKPQPEAAAKGNGKAPPAPSGDDGRIFASPLARRMAAQAGLDLTALSGSGPHGRIIKADIDAALARGPAPAAAPAAKPQQPQAPTPAAAPPAAAQPGEPPFELEPLSQMRKTIARRLTESKQQVPHFYMAVDCRIDALLDLRRQLNARGDAKVSVNDMVIKLVALALIKVPTANVSFSEGGLKRYRQADISVAVATERGLITPIIRQAETKGLATIAAEMQDLAARARDGKLKPEEYQGGTFSISNLGMFGIKHFEAVINPPQACILAVGAGEKRPIVENDAVAIATVMTCTLSVDHRAVDGAVGAEYLQAFKRLVEDPIAMLL